MKYNACEQIACKLTYNTPWTSFYETVDMNISSVLWTKRGFSVRAELLVFG